MTAAAAQPLEPLCIHLHDSDPARLGESDEVAQARIVARGLRVDLDDGFGLVPQARGDRVETEDELGVVRHLV